MSKCRAYCFTLNNYTDVDLDRLEKGKSDTRYLVFGYEVGASGTYHIQGYVEFKNARTLKSMQKWLPRAHFEKRKGTPKQAADYCKKEGKYDEFGEISEQGKRSDLMDVKKSIDNGASTKDLWDNHFPQMVRYDKAFARYRLYHDKKQWIAVSVDAYVGAAGAGKSRTARERYPDLYMLPNPKGGTVWFDGYDGQQTLLIEEIDKTGIDFGYLLQLLDGYPMLLQTKGAFVCKNWNKVILTSNNDPKTWFPELGYPASLERRIEKIVLFNGNEDLEHRKPEYVDIKNYD